MWKVTNTDSFWLELNYAEGVNFSSSSNTNRQKEENTVFPWLVQTTVIRDFDN